MTSEGLLILERLPWASSFLESRRLNFEQAFHAQTNQCKAHTSPPPPPPAFFTHQANTSPTLITSGPGTRQLESTPIAQSLLTLSKLSNPKLAQTCLPALPIPSHRNHSKGPGAMLAYSSFCLLTNPGASLCGPAWCGMVKHGRLPSLGNCE